MQVIDLSSTLFNFQPFQSEVLVFRIVLVFSFWIEVNVNQYKILLLVTVSICYLI